MQVRLMTMNHELEFPNRSIEDIQKKFFMGHEMDESANCKYYAHTKKLEKMDKGDVLLFQMDATIIAYAELNSISIASLELGYRAEYPLKKDSIKIFNPITESELKEHCPNFNRFGQGETELLSLGLDLNWLNKRVK